MNIGRIREIRKAELERRERENHKRNRFGYVASIVAILCFIIDSILFCVLIFRWLKAIIQSLKNKIDWKS